MHSSFTRHKKVLTKRRFKYFQVKNTSLDTALEARANTTLHQDEICRNRN